MLKIIKNTYIFSCQLDKNIAELLFTRHKPRQVINRGTMGWD